MSTPTIRHEWYQTDSHVMISIFIKNLKADQVVVDIVDRSLTVSVKLDGSRESQLDFDPLFLPIIPAESSFAILSTKIEVKLKKASMGTRWELLQGNGSDILSTMNSSVNDAPPAYPSSSKKKHDWNKLEKSVEEEKAEGEQALNQLFQQIFKDGSDETKRAMMKSFQESGGTCLSTDWSKVGKEKVEITPPEGMVAKKYNE
ncbi:SGS domain-containing protein, partial [Globomyces pollinis-pini]